MHVSLQDGWTALMKASVAGQVECVKVLLDRCAEVNMQEKVPINGHYMYVPVY